MCTKYSKEFKLQAVRKVLLKNRETTLTSIAKSIGLSASTLCTWVKTMPNTGQQELPTSGEKIQKTPCTWTSAEKFEAIIGAAKLSPKEIGEYCRKQGIFPHHLEAWKADFIASQNKSKAANVNEVKGLKNEVKSLSTELRRKEKALAETAALLVLKKKHIVFGEAQRKTDF